MRVLIAVPRLDLAGGVANYYRTLRSHLDVEKVYFEIGARTGEAGFLAAMYRLIADFWRFHRKLNSESWDLVHINPSMVMGSIIRDGILLLIARAHRRRVLVFFRGWDLSCAALVLGRYQRLFRAVYGHANAFIVLGVEFKTALEAVAIRRPIFVATTVVSDTLIEAADARSTAPGACDVLYLCRLDSGKGLPEAIQAFAAVQKAWPAVTLTIAGDGPERAAAETNVIRRGLSGVRFLGHVDGAEKSAAFRNADIYFFPTAFAEGMPNSLLEAMACGLPVITRPVGGIRDFFEDGRMGFLTESQDPSVYSALLDRLVGDPGLRLKIGEFNREYARQHFAASVVVKRLIGIYEQVVSQQAAG